MKRGDFGIALWGLGLTALAPVASGWDASLGPGVEAEASLDLGFGAFGNRGTNFGRGRFNPRNGAPEGDPAYGEAFVEPALRFSREFANAGQVYGHVSTAIPRASRAGVTVVSHSRRLRSAGAQATWLRRGSARCSRFRSVRRNSM
jgi:hypothetical protein